jgi:hypothetical protein
VWALANCRKGEKPGIDREEKTAGERKAHYISNVKGGDRLGIGYFVRHRPVG